MSDTAEQLNLWYEVDRNNLITALSPNWDAQVLTQKTPKLMSKHLLEQPLHHFIVGDVTLMFTETMLNAARVKQQTIEKPYRCDTPTLKRKMLMRLTPFSEGSVRVEHSLVEAVPWQYSAQFKQGVSTPKPSEKAPKKHTKGLIKRCSMCNNLRDGDQWITQDVFLHQHPEWIGQTIPVFYGVCPACQR